MRCIKEINFKKAVVAMLFFGNLVVMLVFMELVVTFVMSSKQCLPPLCLIKTGSKFRING